MKYSVTVKSESEFESPKSEAFVSVCSVNAYVGGVDSEGRHLRHSNLTVRVLFLFLVSDGEAVRNDPHPQHGKTPITQGFATTKANFASVPDTLHFPVPHRLQHIHFLVHR